MEDLWPDDIAENKTRSPFSIFKEQGKYLGRKTNNLVLGKIHRLKPGTVNMGDIFDRKLFHFVYKFSI